MNMAFDRGNLYTENDGDLYRIVYDLPIGIVVIDSGNDQQPFLKYANQHSQVMFKINPEDDFAKLQTKFKSLYRWDNTNEVNDTSTLNDMIFSELYEEYSISNFISEHYLIHVKIQRRNSLTVLTIDSYDEYRKTIQSNIIRNIGNQYMLTLYHEINNPLSSLLTSVDEFVNEENSEGKGKIARRINLMTSLIKIFIKNFILYFKMNIEEKSMGGLNFSKVNLEYVLGRIITKYLGIFKYKNICVRFNLEKLGNISVQTDYYHFKSLIKNIFILLYHIGKYGESIEIQVHPTSLNELVIQFMKLNWRTNQCHNHWGENSKTLEEFNKCYDDHTDINTSIQTIQITKSLIEKLSRSLKINTIFYETLETICFSLTMGYENESTEDLSETEEFSGFTIREGNVFVDPRCDIGNYIKNYTQNNIFIKNNNNYNMYQYEDYSTRKDIKHLDNSEGPKSNLGRTRMKAALSKKSLLIDDPKLILLIKSNDSKKTSIVMKYFRSKSYNHDLIKPNNFESIYYSYSKTKCDITENHLKNCQTTKEQSTIDLFCKENFKFKNKLKHMNISKSFVTCIKYDQSIQDDIKNNNVSVSKSSNCNCNEVLIVDDEIFNLNSMKYLVEKKNNIRVDTAMNGEECLKLIMNKVNNPCLRCNKSYYKLILMDIMMPVMDGLEASRKVQSLISEGKVDPRTKICIVSAQKFTQIYDTINSIGVVKDFMPKPVKKEKLNEVLKNIFEVTLC